MNITTWCHANWGKVSDKGHVQDQMLFAWLAEDTFHCKEKSVGRGRISGKVEKISLSVTKVSLTSLMRQFV